MKQLSARISLTALALTTCAVLGLSPATAVAAPAHTASSSFCTYLYNQLRTAPANQRAQIIQEINEYCR